MRYVLVLCLAGMFLCSCVTTMTVLPGKEAYTDDKGKEHSATLATIVMDGPGSGAVEFREGPIAKASLDNAKGDVNIGTNIKDIAVETSKAVTARQVVK